jgi:hypothetical protein
MPNKQDSVQLKLTPEQQKQIQDVTGQLADTLEFSIMELEERIAPIKTTYKAGL